MAKLYWRVKINNKWTWIAADDENTIIVAPTVDATMFALAPWDVTNFKSGNPEAEEE